ncbi:MAG: autotransporter outer membrane beta-barrel domain-containing protein [Verrucomicrobiales bacterium]|nr:autotransporter outer membrane beta-barrel domain-containing protein [Verrucomicrobiales bacterium]
MKLTIIIGALVLPFVTFAQTFTIKDSETTVTNPAGIAPGDSISFQGNIAVPSNTAIDLIALPSGVNITFETGSKTFSGASGGDGLEITGSFNGDILNKGSIISLDDDGVDINNEFSGTFINEGTIKGDDTGINFNRDMAGQFINSGTIHGGEEGVDIDGDLTGSFINSGLIRAADESAVEIEGDLKGTFINLGTLRSIDDEGVDIFDDLSGRFVNRGTIIGGGSDGVFIDRITESGSFTNTGLIQGALDGVYTDGDIRGNFYNSGTIIGRQDGVDTGRLSGNFTNTGTIKGIEGDGVYIDGRLSGRLSNSGTISGLGYHGLHTYGSLSGEVSNTGTISGTDFGILVDANLAGSIFNCGIIEGNNLAGIRSFRTSGVITNDGGRIQGGNFSIRLGRGDGTVILSGPSHLIGKIGGGGGSDTIRFEEMRGINSAKRAELSTLAKTDPEDGSVILFGEVIEWQNIDDIQAEPSSLQSYESLIDGPGLQNYAIALDNVMSLNDEFREFLKELNKVDESLLNEIAANSSGQTLVSGISDFVRNQDSQLYSLLTREFSTLRGDIAGTNQTSAQSSSSFFEREVAVGASFSPAGDTTQTFVSGYAGRGTQSRSLTRQESTYDNTTVLFGANREISHHLRAGIFGGYTDNEGAVDRFGSLLKNEAAYFGFNAQYSDDYLFANLTAGYGFHDQTSIRRDFLGNSMEGDAIGHQGFIYSQVGRDMFFGGKSQTKISPYLGLALSALSMGDFTENGPAATSLRFADESTTAIQSVIGVNASFHRETANGWIKPRVDLAWWHDYTESEGYSVSLASPGLLNGFDLFSPRSNRNRGIIQIGTEFGFDRWEGVSFDLSYFGTTGEDSLSAHGGAFSANFEF